MSELADEWLQRPDHPLLNNVILDLVFSHVRTKNLKTCRLVCKTWNILTIPFTKNAFEVKILRDNSMEDFVQVFRSNHLGIPFSRFLFGSCCLTDEIGQEFLQLFGDTIKSVRCTNCMTVEELSELLKSTPNLGIFETPSIVDCRDDLVINLFPEEGTKPKLACLKKLTISEDNYGQQNTFCPTYMEEIITAAANISSLHLADSIPYEFNFDGGENFEIKSHSLEVLNLIEKLGRESSIQELSISYRMTDRSEYIDLLHKMIDKPNGLKLKRFEYKASKNSSHSNSDSEECPGLFQLVSRFKDTLEHLKTNQNYSNTFIEFPKMSRLKNLSVYLSQDFNSRFVNLNEIFPMLKELELGIRPYQKMKEFFLDSEQCPIMNTLKLHNTFRNLNGFKQVLIIFPNLTKLSICVQEDALLILRQIWVKMTQLKCLSISGVIQSMNGLDSYLTGTGTRGQVGQDHVVVVRGIVDELNHMEGMTSDGRRDMILKLRNQHCQLPSIVNLTGLKSLTLNLAAIEDWHRPGQKGLTDFTGYLGLYSMKRLKHLTIGSCEFTKTCCEILTKDLGLESWSFKKSLSSEIIPSE